MTDEINKKILGDNIRGYLRMHDKSQKDVCRDLGIHEATFNDWVNGRSYPRIDKIEKLAKYFGVKKSDLVEDQTDMDEDTKRYLNMLYENYKYRVLLDSSKKLSQTDLDFLIQFISKLGG